MAVGCDSSRVSVQVCPAIFSAQQTVDDSSMRFPAWHSLFGRVVGKGERTTLAATSPGSFTPLVAFQFRGGES